MPAAVGIKDANDGNVTGAGVFSSNNAVATQARNVPIMAGSTVIEKFSDGDLNAAAQLQGGSQWNPYQEINLLLGEFARQWGVSPVAAARRLQTILTSIAQQHPA